MHSCRRPEAANRLRHGAAIVAACERPRWFGQYIRLYELEEPALIVESPLGRSLYQPSWWHVLHAAGDRRRAGPARQRLQHRGQALRVLHEPGRAANTAGGRATQTRWTSSCVRRKEPFRDHADVFPRGGPHPAGRVEWRRGSTSPSRSVPRPYAFREWNRNEQPDLPQHPTRYPFAGFGRRSAVLTWANSD